MYGDQILNTETINETLSNRRSAKMLFLQYDNEQLMQENCDLRDALKLNKEALKIAYSSSSNLTMSSTMVSGIAFNKTTANGGGGGSTQFYQEEAAIKIIQENEKLLSMLAIMSKERSKAQSIVRMQQHITSPLTFSPSCIQALIQG